MKAADFLNNYFSFQSWRHICDIWGQMMQQIQQDQHKVLSF